MPNYHATNIIWDTDQDPLELDLPRDADIWAASAEDVADELSNEYGWCVLELDVEEADSGPDPMSLAKECREDQLMGDR